MDQGYRVITDLADRERVDTGLRQLQLLEARVAELADGMQALGPRPASATAAELQSARQVLEERIGLAEQALANRATSDDLQTLRTELEQIKAHEATARVPAPSQVRSPKPAAAKPRVAPFPYRVVGAELRAGLRSVSVAPATGEITAEQLQVMLPGDAIGRWRLQAIDGNTAVFQAGGQARRLAIP